MGTLYYIYFTFILEYFIHLYFLLIYGKNFNWIHKWTFPIGYPVVSRLFLYYEFYLFCSNGSVLSLVSFKFLYVTDPISDFLLMRYLLRLYNMLQIYNGSVIILLFKSSSDDSQIIFLNLESA